MNKQSLTQSRVTNILEVARRENLEHVVITTEDLKAMQNMLLALQNANGCLQLERERRNEEIKTLQSKLQAAEERDDLKGRTIDSLKEKLAELGETVFVQQFGRVLRTPKENPVFSISTPHGPITATKAHFKRLYQGEWKPEEVEQKQDESVGKSSIKIIRFNAVQNVGCWRVFDAALDKYLPFQFTTVREAETLAAVLNSFVTKE